MLKVIIADDEERVCRLVQMLADWGALGMEVAGTAANGLEALELVERIKPDILITDIRMPGCDGLELIERAKAMSPNLEIALISGYAQFEYAQTAIRLDVGGYILKPIKKAVLTDTLAKLGAKCRERAASSNDAARMLRDSHKSGEILRGRLLEDLLSGQTTGLTPEKLSDEYGFSVSGGVLQAVILKIDCSPELFYSRSIDVIIHNANDIFCSAISGLCGAYIFRFRQSAGYGVLNYSQPNQPKIRRALRECLNSLEARLPGAVEFSLAIGKAVTCAADLPTSLLDAQAAIAERLVEGTGRLFEGVPVGGVPFGVVSVGGVLVRGVPVGGVPVGGVPVGPRFDAARILGKYDRLIELAVSAFSLEEADAAVDELSADLAVDGLSEHTSARGLSARTSADGVSVRTSADGVSTGAGGTGDVAGVAGVAGLHGHIILDIVTAAGRSFIMRINSPGDQGLTAEFEERCALCSSAGKLTEYLRAFQREQISFLREKLENEAIRPIRVAKQYIAQNYSKPVTLEDVCAAIGFSVSYFSTLFKKETGEGFSRYLSRVRIERAKELLQDTNLSVAEICGQVGYSDIKHFTGTFKKMTNLSPGQFRKIFS